MASSACATFARHAYSSWERMPGLLANSESVGAALRRVVDEARLEALSDSTYVNAGLVMALSERALTRTLLLPLHELGATINSLNPRQASSLWSTQERSPDALQGEFLVQIIQSVTMHLVLRDGPQLVGGRIGTSSDVAALADEMATIAGNISRRTADKLSYANDESAWNKAINEAWGFAADLVRVDPDHLDNKPPPYGSERGHQ
ncbi:hypothetical protein [Rhodococcus sp. EPR-279]|uniref:hypothetical protein n=1 Tax=Rhodococcus sp. EPR-279 TaxID=1813678 RepID=UPI001E42F338|nr:hypothetical protein [Rhodococcus sp. EPR-279]